MFVFLTVDFGGYARTQSGQDSVRPRGCPRMILLRPETIVFVAVVFDRIHSIASIQLARVAFQDSVVNEVSLVFRCFKLLFDFVLIQLAFIATDNPTVLFAYILIRKRYISKKPIMVCRITLICVIPFPFFTRENFIFLLENSDR